MTRPTFAALPAADLDSLGSPTIVLFGASEATPYDPAEPSHSADAPAAIRIASREFARQLGQLDFDLGFVPFPDPDDARGVVDVGDIATSPDDAPGNRERIEAATRTVLAAGAVPIVLGGDDSVPIPVAAGFADAGPLTIVQIDAHVDWGDVIRDEPLGYGSPMRRLAEMPHVTGMIQVGIRGLGSGGAWQIADAHDWGSRIVTGYDLLRHGIDAAIAQVPAGGRYLISIDCDGIDPAAFPAVAMPTPGGMRYEEVVLLLRGLAERGTIAGLVLAEYVPARDDPHRLCATMAARITAVTMGLILGEG
ncbi:arginase family protein [Sphingomonas sp. CFBP 13720]|uniref:arginase family protein n=1 Tax=Sphingomonas sp. CFBP 13720 TaxID=2775302 RepID=UPI00178311BA|nr:arginase family protein [Sphingomonas sp. CFBP 13720]MBD8678835.1 arginase family protein [Sphingomonas sp. CFBP 13720]